VRWGALLALSLAVGCASPDPAPWQPARLTLEVLRGFDSDEIASPAAGGAVSVLVDSTRSMEGGSVAGTAHGVAARRAARRFVEALPSATPVWLYAMGAEPGDACLPPPRIGRAARSEERGRLLDQLGRLRFGGEAGLADSLDRLRSDLESAGRAAGSRVVVFSDLAGDCGGDPCAAAERLARAGARLDVVVIGNAPVPACLHDAGAVAVDLPPLGREKPGARYCIEVTDPEPLVAGCSAAGGPPVAAPTGRGTVVVELDPPLRVDAYFAPGRDLMLQVLDFPALDPPTRQWRWREAPLELGGKR